jgi:V8-like Glu-specific endopeptidase
MIAFRPLRLAVAVFAVPIGVASCSGHSGSSVHLPGFADVYQAPPAIQTAARAVVRIGTTGELATGSFISPNGILLTNNHVLGVGICPAEGCYAQLTFMYQRHSSNPVTESVFVKPIAVDIGLDMAVVQTYDTSNNPLATPDYLTIDSHDPASLVGTHVHVVGHPEGHLKKWSQGEVIDTSGQWIWFSAYALPGNSGSPILDDDGHMVGILHRGPSSQDLISSNGVDEYSIGTASSALVAAMAAPLPASIWSTQTPTDDNGAVAHQQVYLNARVATAQVGGAPKQIIDSLGTACDAALAVQSYASPDDLESALAPCFEATAWIDCIQTTGNSGSAASSPGFSVCPTDVAAWQQRYQSAFDALRMLNGMLELDLVTFAPEYLATSKQAGFASAAQNLQATLAAANPPLDFTIANVLAAFGVFSYQGTSLVDYVHNYGKVPGYGIAGTDIASTALWLFDNGAISRTDVLSVLQSLASDPNVDEGAKLYVEDELYQAHSIN